jgi:hypothetical protein
MVQNNLTKEVIIEEALKKHSWIISPTNIDLYINQGPNITFKGFMSIEDDLQPEVSYRVNCSYIIPCSTLRYIINL